MKMEVREIARAVLAMGVKKGRVAEVDSGMSLEEAASKNLERKITHLVKG